MVPLRRGAVRERLGVDPALRLLLDPVIPDRGGGRQALLQVAAFEDAAVIGRAGPDAGEAIGLELEAHGEGIRVIRVVLALLPNLSLDPELLLDVVAELVRDHVGLGEVAGGLEASVELVEEAEVDVDPLIEWAVERPGLRAGRATAGVGLPTEEDQLGGLERLAG